MTSPGLTSPFRGLGRYSRAAEWWEYKLVPIFSIFYATAAVLDVGLLSLWPAALLLLLALAPGATYVSVVNDLTDREADRAAGKPNRMEAAPAWLAAVIVGGTVLVGAAFLIAWRGSPVLFGCYLAAWTAYSLYSWPPVRLKERGFWGVLADAAGAHVFPTLVALLMVFRSLDRPIDYAWLFAVAAWSLGYGLRGILRHQINDAENDRRAGVRTFVQRRSVSAAVRVGVWAAFPIEVAGLTVVLLRLGSPWAVAGLMLYVLVEVVKWRLWKTPVVVVGRPGPHLIVGQGYYEALLPLSLLVASALRSPADVAFLAAHVVLFPNRITTLVADMARLARALFGRAGYDVRRAFGRAFRR